MNTNVGVKHLFYTLLVGWLAAWLVGWLVDGLVGWLVGWWKDCWHKFPQGSNFAGGFICS